jgi:hypothetical protein
MGRLIYLHPRHAQPGQLLLLARQRAGLTHAEIAPLLGDAIGRPELNPATVRAWERGTVQVPSKVLDAAHHIASSGAPRTVVDRSPDSGESGTPGPDAVEHAMQSFREADRRVGGGYMYGSVVRYLRDEIAPSLVDTSENRFGAVAALTEMAGWMAHDAGHDDLAQSHFDRALQFTALSDDVELTAHVHASLSHLAMQHERPRDALRRAQAALSLLRRHPHHPALAARLHAMQARALAGLRRRADSARALFRAETALDQLAPDTQSPWVSPFDHGSLAAEACQAFETLGDLPAARTQAELVITLRDGNHVRSRAFGQLRLAGILLAQGEVDQACTITVDALQQSDGVSSRRVSQLVRSLHVSLTPHAAASEAQRATSALTAALARPDPLHLITTTHSQDERDG